MERYKLIVDIPFLKKNELFDFDIETGDIYLVFKGNTNQYALRSGLSGYLWLLKTEGNKYFKRIKG